MAEDHPRKVRKDFLGNDASTPANEVGTFRCRALHSNHVAGHLYSEYGSETLRGRPVVADIPERNENQGQRPRLLPQHLAAQRVGDGAVHAQQRDRSRGMRQAEECGERLLPQPLRGRLRQARRSAARNAWSTTRAWPAASTSTRSRCTTSCTRRSAASSRRSPTTTWSSTSAFARGTARRKRRSSAPASWCCRRAAPPAFSTASSTSSSSTTSSSPSAIRRDSRRPARRSIVPELQAIADDVQKNPARFVDVLKEQIGVHPEILRDVHADRGERRSPLRRRPARGGQESADGVSRDAVRGGTMRPRLWIAFFVALSVAAARLRLVQAAPAGHQVRAGQRRLSAEDGPGRGRVQVSAAAGRSRRRSRRRTWPRSTRSRSTRSTRVCPRDRSRTGLSTAASCFPAARSGKFRAAEIMGGLGRAALHLKGIELDAVGETPVARQGVLSRRARAAQPDRRPELP